MAQVNNMAPTEMRIADLSQPGAAANVEISQPTINKSGEPFFLVLSRNGVVDTVLRDPSTNDIVYRIRDTGRGSLSSKPDYEVYRASSGEMFVGSIRFGRRSTEIDFPLTGHKVKGVEKVQLHHLAGGVKDLIWKTVKSQRKRVKDRWIETNNDGKAELMTNEEVIILELVDAAGQTDNPICVVRLYNTQPNGRFEVWADYGGDWHALDEIMLSAYANMETAKRDLMSGLDPSSWRGAAF